MQPLSSNDPVRIGKYWLLAELGRGATGRVLLAYSSNGRPVALKLVHEWLAEDEEFRARFSREAHALRRISGPYTAVVVDAGPDDPVPWLASEFHPGPTLQEAVNAAGPLHEETVLRLAAGLASALASIHKAGVIHQDLKPSNVILAADGPRVIDFGITRDTERSGSDGSHIVGLLGTPEFMAPELIESEPSTVASDMFSLGTLLVLACTGASPFAGENTLDTMNNVCRAELDLTEVPERVLRIAERCLSREPGDRPTPAEVLALIGPVAPTATPWPQVVSALTNTQRRELERALPYEGAEPRSLELSLEPLAADLSGHIEILQFTATAVASGIIGATATNWWSRTIRYLCVKWRQIVRGRSAAYEFTGPGHAISAGLAAIERSARAGNAQDLNLADLTTQALEALPYGGYRVVFSTSRTWATVRMTTAHPDDAKMQVVSLRGDID